MILPGQGNLKSILCKRDGILQKYVHTVTVTHVIIKIVTVWTKTVTVENFAAIFPII